MQTLVLAVALSGTIYYPSRLKRRKRNQPEERVALPLRNSDVRLENSNNDPGVPNMKNFLNSFLKLFRRKRNKRQVPEQPPVPQSQKETTPQPPEESPIPKAQKVRATKRSQVKESQAEPAPSGKPKRKRGRPRKSSSQKKGKPPKD
jgi:hypothetical protein